jgi:hypothetical protein
VRKGGNKTIFMIRCREDQVQNTKISLDFIVPAGNL